MTFSYKKGFFIIFVMALPLVLNPITPIYGQGEPFSPISNSSCISFDSEQRIITITCNSANLTDIYNTLDDDNILKKEATSSNLTGNLQNKNQWILDAGIIVSPGSTLYINSSDTAWLKIVASADTEAANGINVFGTLKIDSVKITSWNLEENDFVRFEYDILPSRELQYSDINTVPRPYLRIDAEATGTMDITNSELAYLGYHPADNDIVFFGRSGLNYYGGDGSLIKGNHIHHNNWGFYSSGIRNLVFENNHVHHNYMYGLDPHSGTNNMIIRNNVVHDHGAMGIICSLDCYDILIEGNKVYNSAGSGIMLSRNMTDSIVRDNIVYNETQCIFVSASHNNEIYNNDAKNCKNGIYLKSESSNNNIYNNEIRDTENGILISSGASDNNFHDNIINNATEQDISISEDAGEGNTFDNNNINDPSLIEDSNLTEDDE